jgi:exodeoxyribonuclease VII small subunit
MPKPEVPTAAAANVRAEGSDRPSGTALPGGSVLEPGVGAVPENSTASGGQLEAAPTGFEEALAELETIVARMESGELTLEQSLAAYKRGAALLQYCQLALRDAQQQVKVLESGLLQDFADSDEDGQ